MTNREYIEKCFAEKYAAMSDDELHSCFLEDFFKTEKYKAIKDRCSYCKNRVCADASADSDEDCGAITVEQYMSREVEFSD